MLLSKYTYTMRQLKMNQEQKPGKSERSGESSYLASAKSNDDALFEGTLHLDDLAIGTNYETLQELRDEEAAIEARLEELEATSIKLAPEDIHF